MNPQQQQVPAAIRHMWAVGQIANHASQTMQQGATKQSLCALLNSIVNSNNKDVKTLVDLCINDPMSVLQLKNTGLKMLADIAPMCGVVTSDPNADAARTTAFVNSIQTIFGGNCSSSAHMSWWRILLMVLAGVLLAGAAAAGGYAFARHRLVKSM